MSREQSVGASSLALEAWVNLEGSGKPLKDSGEGRVVVRGWCVRFTRSGRGWEWNAGLLGSCGTKAFV